MRKITTDPEQLRKEKELDEGMDRCYKKAVTSGLRPAVAQRIMTQEFLFQGKNLTPDQLEFVKSAFTRFKERNNFPETQETMSDPSSTVPDSAATPSDAATCNHTKHPPGPTFRGQDLRKYNFKGKVALGVSFIRSDFQGADLRGVQFPDGLNLTESNFNGADLRGANFTGCDVSMSNFDGSDMRGSVMVCTDLCCANLRGVDARGSAFLGATLCAVDGEGSNFSGSTFEDADLRDGKFPGAFMRGCSWENTIIKDSCTCGADLSGASGTPADDPEEEASSVDVSQHKHAPEESTRMSFGKLKNEYEEH